MTDQMVVHVVAASAAVRGQIAAACCTYGQVAVASQSATLSEVALQTHGPVVLVMPFDDLFDPDTFACFAGMSKPEVTIILVGNRTRAQAEGIPSSPTTFRILPTDGSRRDLHRKLEVALAVTPSNEGTLVQPHFSIQELSALQLYASGLQLVEVATQMGVKVTTAKEYVQRVRQKYEAVGRPAPSKLHLRINAQQDGLLD